MAAVVRHPFAPIDGARLQALTSTKNRQNAVLSPAAKRKAPPAWAPETDDSENVDPGFFSKRCKASDGFSPINNVAILKKPVFTLTKAGSSASELADSITSSTVFSSPRARAVLKPKAPSTKLGGTGKVAPMSAFASLTSSISSRNTPARTSFSRRGGILSSRRRTTSSFSRSTASSSNFGSAAPFSLDAALKGTLSTYESRLASSSLSLDDGSVESAWIFDIHEDTPEQEMTNLLQHSTCVLDISSDEESEQKARRERAEGRDKENIPPPNDVSQTSLRGAARAAAEAAPADENDMSVEKSRNPLGQLNAADFYAAGCDEASVVFVQDEEEEVEEEAHDAPHSVVVEGHEEAVEGEALGAESSHLDTPAVPKTADTVEAIMGCQEEPCAPAALLEPIEGTGESFQLWESGSAKDDDDVVSTEPTAASPL